MRVEITLANAKSSLAIGKSRPAFGKSSLADGESKAANANYNPAFGKSNLADGDSHLADDVSHLADGVSHLAADIFQGAIQSPVGVSLPHSRLLASFAANLGAPSPYRAGDLASEGGQKRGYISVISREKPRAATSRRRASTDIGTRLCMRSLNLEQFRIGRLSAASAVPKATAAKQEHQDHYD